MLVVHGQSVRILFIPQRMIDSEAYIVLLFFCQGGLEVYSTTRNRLDKTFVCGV